MHWIYILKCQDDYIYVGETRRLFRRIHEHISGNGGDNTSTWEPESLVAIYKVPHIENFINYNKNVTNALNGNDYDKWLLYNFNKVLYDEECDTDIVKCRFLECENNIIECMMINNKDNWNKFRGGKYVKFNTNDKFPINEYIKELPLCKCGLPCDIKKNDEKNYLYFRCSKKNIYPDLIDRFKNDEDYSFPVENKACNFFKEYKKDIKFRSTINNDTIELYNKLVKKSLWLRYVQNVNQYNSMNCVGNCNKGLIYSKMQDNSIELYLCHDCFINKNNELKDKYEEKFEPFVKNIPKLSERIGSPTWEQKNPCVHCGRISYNPIFHFGYRQVCKICLGNHSNELKEKYGKIISWF